MFSNTKTRKSLLKKLEQTISNCSDCPLHENKTYSIPGYFPDNCQPDIMLIGEAPGETEDLCGEPFVGSAGQVLNIILRKNNIERHRLSITNIVKCRPPNNRTPNEGEIKACLPYLVEQIKQLRPIVIVPMGVTAAETILQKKVKITRERGKLMLYKYPDGKVCAILPTIHPSAILHNPNWKTMLEDDFGQLSKISTIKRFIDQHTMVKEEIECLPLFQAS